MHVTVTDTEPARCPNLKPVTDEQGHITLLRCTQRMFPHHVCQFEEKQELPKPEPIYPTWPKPKPSWNEALQCSQCGIQLSGTMGYVCPNSPCPSGLGGTYC